MSICAPVSADNYIQQEWLTTFVKAHAKTSKLLFPEKLPHAGFVSRLYSVEVLERRDDRVKMHYIGYDTKFDEWHKEDETYALPMR